MKLVFAVVNNDDVTPLIDRLVKAGFGVTKLSSSGGFLRAKNTTLMIGVEENKVDNALEIIKDKSSKKTITIAASVNEPLSGDAYPSIPVDVTVGGATVFVTNVEKYEKF